MITDPLIDAALEEMRGVYALSVAEYQIARLAVDLQIDRLPFVRPVAHEIAEARGVLPSTIKKQIQFLLAKTMHRTLAELVIDVLRRALELRAQKTDGAPL